MAGTREAVRERHDDICIALTTASSADEAKRLAHLLVERRVAACVNILPGVRSVYRWKGKVEDVEEVMLVIKTSRGQASALQDVLNKNHSYQVPEFLLLPVVAGATGYMAWLREGLGPL